MNIYQQLGHRPPQQREQRLPQRPPPLNADENNGRPLPAPAHNLPPLRPAHLDPDRVLPPLATPADGSKFIPLWKRNLHSSPASGQQPPPPVFPKKKWLTQAEMGMVGPAIIPIPIPTARTSTTTTTTTTTNTSTTTNNNVGTTVSSSGSGITASSVTGRTFNYNYNNYNHHVHQFNQPPAPNNRPASFAPPPTSVPSYNNNHIGQAKKPMNAWRARAPASDNGENEDDEEDEEDEESESQQDSSEQEESSSASSSPQYGILDLPSHTHRRARSQRQHPSSLHRDACVKHNPKHKSKKKGHPDTALPTPPAVLVLQAPDVRRSSDYAPAFAYEYSLMYDRGGAGRHAERTRGHHNHPKWGEENDEATGESDQNSEEDSEEEEEEEKESPPPKKSKKLRLKGAEKKGGKGKSSKSKSKIKTTVKKRSTKSRKARDEEEESEEEENSEEDEESEEESEHDTRRKPKNRLSTSPKSDKRKTKGMSLEFASFGINDDYADHRGKDHHPQHRLSRSEDYTRQSHSSLSNPARSTPMTSMPNRWPADLPRLPRTPGTPAASNVTPAPSTSGFGSPSKRENGYFDYQPHQLQSYSQPSSQAPSDAGAARASYMSTTTSVTSSTPASAYSTPTTSYTSVSDKARERKYMNLDDPPPPSLKRTPSPAVSSSSHSHTRSLPSIGTDMVSRTAAPSAPRSAYEQIRARVQQSQVQAPAQSLVQSRPQEPTRRYTQPLSGPPDFRSSQAFWQQQQSVQTSSQIQHRPLPSNNNSVNNNEMGNRHRPVNGSYGPPQPPAPPVPAPESSASSRRRELPPQPTEGRERAQQILKEARERQGIRLNPQVQPQLPQQQQQRKPLPQTNAAAASLPRQQQQGQKSQQQARHPLPQPVPPVQQRQSQPQQSQHSQHPLPQPPQQQRQKTSSHQRQHSQQPPLAQRNVYRPLSMPIESPAPVGGRDRVADIPRMGKAASVVGSAYGSGTESEEDNSRGATEVTGSNDGKESGDAIPGIVISVTDNPRRTVKTPASAPASSPRMPLIRIQGHGEEEDADSQAAVPRVQVFEVPGISFTGPEDGNNNGGAPSISVSGPDDASRAQPQIRAPQQRARSAPAPAGANPGAVVRRNQGGLSCGGCSGPIIGRIVNAMGMRWHPGCFRCSVCDTLLEHVSSYEHEGRPYCHLDYHEHFAPRCYHCETAIIEERFISLDDPALGKRTYHEQHFFCAECGDPFLAPSTATFDQSEKRSGELALNGDGEFESDDVGFTVYRGHPYCETCHVRLRLPKCKRCKKSIRDGDRAVEALGGKWCWACFVCESCQKPFDDPSFFQRGEKPYCEPCFSVMLRNEV
ncbi:hypothetical protein AX17_002515 [Amanita inopinata Kibby_2008]|nr:hypothetical protein AX17_002515 [Amanita inopinata Kibby_2008]